MQILEASNHQHGLHSKIDLTIQISLRIWTNANPRSHRIFNIVRAQAWVGKMKIPHRIGTKSNFRGQQLLNIVHAQNQYFIKEILSQLISVAHTLLSGSDK